MIALIALGVLLAAISAHDCRSGNVPLGLLIAVPVLGIAVDPARDWRIGAMIGAALLGAALIAGLIARRFHAQSRPLWGFGAADLVLIGGAGFWMDANAAELPGVFLILAGAAALIWAQIWRRIGRSDWSGPDETAQVFPALPPLCLSLLAVAGYQFFTIQPP